MDIINSIISLGGISNDASNILYYRALLWR
ncbi:Uncharacterised protein [Klebsiella aerogenes]|nr:Uncharacterised protein [Klebsiella aerogenes]